MEMEEIFGVEGRGKVCNFVNGVRLVYGVLVE